MRCLRVDGRCQQVDRIPDTPFLYDAEQTTEDGHGDAAGEAAFDTCGDWICFEWQQRARQMRRHRKPGDFATRGGDHGRFHFYVNRLFLFLREDIPEPADESSNTE